MFMKNNRVYDDMKSMTFFVLFCCVLILFNIFMPSFISSGSDAMPNDIYNMRNRFYLCNTIIGIFIAFFSFYSFIHSLKSKYNKSSLIFYLLCFFNSLTFIIWIDYRKIFVIIYILLSLIFFIINKLRKANKCYK